MEVPLEHESTLARLARVIRACVSQRDFADDLRALVSVNFLFEVLKFRGNVLIFTLLIINNIDTE